jgi:hypothetical protein
MKQHVICFARNWEKEKGEELGDEMDCLCGNEEHRIRWTHSLHDICWDCLALPTLFSTNICLIGRDRKKAVQCVTKQHAMDMRTDGGGIYSSTHS